MKIQPSVNIEASKPFTYFSRWELLKPMQIPTHPCTMLSKNTENAYNKAVENYTAQKLFKRFSGE